MIREEKIEDLRGQDSELNGDLEKSYLSQASTDASIHQSRVEYRRIFEENEALMLDGINKGKQVKQLQQELLSES